MRRCTSCGQSKPVEEFAQRHQTTGTLQSWCRACHAAKDRLRYSSLEDDARSLRRSRERARKAATKQRVDAILAASGCVDCGERDPIVLEFDHVGPKLASVSVMVRQGLSWARISREIAKCEVRCVNDHKRVTAQRRAARQKRAPAVVPGDPGGS